MTGSDGRSAAQLLTPGQEPLFFDDLGCLRDYLRQQGTLPAETVAFVADHRAVPRTAAPLAPTHLGDQPNGAPAAASPLELTAGEPRRLQ